MEREFKIYLWVFYGFLISGLSAFLFYSSLISDIIKVILFISLLILLIPSAMIMNPYITKKTTVLSILAYTSVSLFFGMFFFYVFRNYTTFSVIISFIITSLLFLIMAIYGIITKKDLSRKAKALGLPFIGVLILFIAIYFFRGTFIEYIISFVAILLFSFAVAYENQMNKRDLSITEVVAGSRLYLLFFNIFAHITTFTAKKKKK